MKRLAVVMLLGLSGVAAADDPPPADKPAEPPPTPAVPSPAEVKLKAQVDDLNARMKKVEEALDEAKDDNSYLEDKLKSLLPIAAKLGGYVDVGFFATDGNGAGTRSDLAGTYFPEYAGKIDGSWVFMGDPLSTTVNSRGDVADTGDSRAITFDPINSKGKSTFLVNNVNLALFSALGETSSAQVSVDFVPRARDVSNVGGLFVGDYIDVKLAYGEWKPELKKLELALQAGKFDSVVGYEYRSLESPDRLGITPSLICRYTCGRPIGLKARARFLEDKNLIVNVTVINGSQFSEGFPFADETDTNQFKTLAGRLSYKIADKLELGVSGAWGAQDYQPKSDIYQWHYGFDAHLEVKDLEFTGEFVQGKARGETTPGAVVDCDLAPCIHYKGAYGLVGYRVTNMFVPYARVDWRDAVHESGTSFIYISDLMRFTAGIRLEIGTRVIVKAEGTLNRELGRIPQFPDDVLTTSLVLKL